MIDTAIKYNSGTGIAQATVEIEKNGEKRIKNDMYDHVLDATHAINIEIRGLGRTNEEAQKHLLRALNIAKQEIDEATKQIEKLFRININQESKNEHDQS